MQRHKDLISILKSKGKRITPVRRLLVQFFIDNNTRQISLQELSDFINSRIHSVDRSSIYRNLETLKKLDIIQEMKLPKVGKRFQYIFDTKLHHYYICKSCGKLSKGNQSLFKQIEKMLSKLPGFHDSNLSLVFYGYCSRCSAADCWSSSHPLP